jgi:hypothetical protein
MPVVVVAGLIGAVALTVMLDALFTQSPGHQWATAVQATATLVLVGVTGVYVWISYRQMQYQATPLVAIRLAAQEQAARQAVGLFQRTKRASEDVIRDVEQVKQSGEPNSDSLNAHDSVLFELVREMSALAPGLPATFALRLWPTISRCINGVTEVYLFSHACSLERLAATRGERKWSWDGARKSYLADVRDPKLDHPEWDDLVSLVALRGAMSEVSKVEVDVTAYLLTPAQRISR